MSPLESKATDINEDLQDVDQNLGSFLNTALESEDVSSENNDKGNASGTDIENAKDNRDNDGVDVQSDEDRDRYCHHTPDLQVQDKD